MVLVSPSRRRRTRRPQGSTASFDVSVIRFALYAACLFLLAISFISLELQSQKTSTTAVGVDDLIRPPQQRSLRQEPHSVQEIELPATQPPNATLPTLIELEDFNVSEGNSNLSRDRKQDPLSKNVHQERDMPGIGELERKEDDKAKLLLENVLSEANPASASIAVKNTTTFSDTAASTDKRPLQPASSPPTPISSVRPNTTLAATNAAHASVLHALHTTVHSDVLLTAAPQRTPSSPLPASEQQEPPPVHRIPATSHVTQAPIQATPGPRSPVMQNTTLKTIDTAPKEQPPVSRPKPPPSLFVIVADSRSASDWILSRLDNHPAVCSATELGGFDSGFPLGIMLPDGMPWLLTSDIRQGCTLRFIRDHVQDLLDTAKTNSMQLPQQCHDDASISPEDGLRVHYPRLCRFAQKMLEEGSYDPNNRDVTAAAITHMYMKAYESNDGDLLACQCPEATQVRGFKAMSDWIPRIPGFLDETYEGLKVIRLHRRNVVARYMSLTAAMHTNIWQTHSATEKERQLQLLAEKNVTIDPDDLMRQIRFMHKADNEADQWTLEHVENPLDDVLSIEYEDCRDDSLACFSSIFEFIGLSNTQTFLSSRKEDFTSTFRGSKPAEVASLLQHAGNKQLIETVLAGKQLGHFVGVNEETDKLLHLQIVPRSHRRVSKPMGDNIETVIAFLDDRQNKPKFGDATTRLASLPPDAGVVVSALLQDEKMDVHHQIRSIGQYYSSFTSFRNAMKEVTDKGTVVVSATHVCCAAALSHVSPGDLVSMNGTVVDRNHRACESGSPGCLWENNEQGNVWRQRFESMAVRHSKDPNLHPVYPAGSVMVGKVKDVLKLLNALQIEGNEDDRAVLADYMLQNPQAVVLDYDERLFGRQFSGVKQPESRGCFPDSEQLTAPTSTSNKTLQLFSHEPRSLECRPTTLENPESFPKWGDDEIKIEAIVEHVDALFARNETFYGITEQFRPEILYAIGKDGMLSTTRETEPYRITPTESLYSRATDILLSDANDGGEKWPRLQKILKTGSTVPFWAWFGDYKGCNFHNGGRQYDDSVPVFTTSATQGCNYAFPSPDYASILEAKEDPSDWYSTFQQYDNDYPWQSKIRKIVWRGSLSESDPSRVFSSIRWQLCQRVASQSNLKDFFDVGLTEISPGLRMDVDVSNAGGFKPQIDPDAFQRYTAILDMDGNSWSSRFDHLLCFNSVVLKVEPEYLDYFHFELRPWKHYIPIKRDLSDLEEIARFIADPANDAMMLDVVAAANHWCSEHMLLDQLAYDQLHLWEQYVSLLDHGNPRWKDKWEEKRSLLEAPPYNLSPLQRKKP